MILDKKARTKIAMILIFGILFIFIVNFIIKPISALNLQNQTDGFSISPIGSTGNANDFETNGSDFWILDVADDFVYHVNRTGNNQSDGFKTNVPFGFDFPLGITRNGSDFWITEYTVDYFTHYDSLGVYVSPDAYQTSTFGSDSPRGIATTNGSDFWIVDQTDNFVYHVNRTGGNLSDGFSGDSFGSSAPNSITTNGSDFWIVDQTDDFVYHVNRTGGNLSDGFSGDSFGSTTTLTSVRTNGSDFWVYDGGDLFIYHLRDLDYISPNCSPLLNSDWIITDEQICDNKEVTVGTGNITVQGAGSLTLIGGANVTANSILINGTGDKVFINRGSELRLNV